VEEEAYGGRDGGGGGDVGKDIVRDLNWMQSVCNRFATLVIIVRDVLCNASTPPPKIFHSAIGD